MPGDIQVIFGSVVDKNRWSPASTKTPASLMKQKIIKIEF